MKRLLAAALASAMMLSLAACNEKPKMTCDGGTETMKEPESETIEKIVITDPDDSLPSPEAPFTEADISKYVRDARDTYKHLEKDEHAGYHVPEILIDSDCAKSVNEEIAKRFEMYEAAIVKDGESHYYASEYIAYLTKEGILTVVFVEIGMWDDDIYHVYCIDVTTGSYADNARLAEISGVTGIGAAAKDAVQAYYNASGQVKIENYKVVSANDSLNGMEQAIQDSFGDDRLNDTMLIGLKSDGTMFFISALGSFGGAEWYYRMYDVAGNDLHDYDKGDPGWVRGK